MPELSPGQLVLQEAGLMAGPASLNLGQPEEDDEESKRVGTLSPGQKLLQEAGLSPGSTERRGLDAPTTFLGKTVDVLARPGYAVAKFADQILNEPGVAIGKALSESLGELVHPDERLTFSDVLKKKAPVFAAEGNGVPAEILGFVLDVATDPTTYLGIGAIGKTVKIPKLVERAAALGKVTEEAFKDAAASVKAIRSTGVSLPGWLEKDASLARRWFKGELSAERAAAKSVDLHISDAALVRTSTDGIEALPKNLRKKGSDYLGRLEELRNLQGMPGFLAAQGQAIIKRKGHLTLTKEGETLLSKFIREETEAFGKNATLTGAEAIEIRQSAEHRIARMALDPELAKKLTKPLPGIRLGKLELVPRSVFEAVAEKTGLSRLGESVKGLPIIRNLRKAFLNNVDIPPELQRYLKQSEADFRQSAQRVMSRSYRLFSEHTTEERERLGRAMASIDDLARTQESNARLLAHVDPTGAPQEFLPKSSSEMARAVREILDKHEIKGKLRETYFLLRDEYQRVGELEQQVGLVGSLISHYSPRYWELIEDNEAVDAFIRTSRTSKVRDPSKELFFGPGLQRQFDTIKAGENFVDPLTGIRYKPTYDAGILYTQRMLESRKKLAKELFRQRALSMFPGLEATSEGFIRATKNRKAIHALKEVYGFKTFKRTKEVLENVAERMTFFSEGLYSRANPSELDFFARVYDRATQAFRVSATVLKAGFGPRQLVSNTVQSYLGLGKSAFNPSSYYDAALILNHRAGSIGEIRSAIGELITGDQLAEEVTRLGVARGVTVDGIEAGVHIPRTPKEFSRAMRRAEKLQGARHQDQAVAEGFRTLFSSLSRYTEIPGHIEDFNRVALYANARRLGHSAEESLKIVDDQLFDYLNGLSRFESRILRRVIPFYSFQRFAVPMVARAVAKAPGRVVNTKRATETLMKAFNKFSTQDALTPEEREVLPGWLLENPTEFAGFNDSMEAVFHGFNNFGPLEVLSFMQLDDEGRIDLRETLTHGALAQLTPFIKVPLEWAMKEEFFTGRTIDDARTGKAIDPDKFLANLTGLVLATGAALNTNRAVGTPGVNLAAGKATVEALNRVFPNFSEQTLGVLLGYEKGINRRTGEQTAYFSPWRYYALMNMLPGLSEAVRTSHLRSGPYDGAMSFLFGINTFSLDLPQELQGKMREARTKQGKLTSETKRSALEQRWRDYEDRRAELQQYLLTLANRWEGFRAEYVRGPGNPELPQ